MCYKSPGVEEGKSTVRPLSPEGMARRPVGIKPGRNYPCAPPTRGAIGPQLKIVALAASPRPDAPLQEGFPLGFGSALDIRDARTHVAAAKWRGLSTIKYQSEIK
jgi:hypothetical protein